MGNDKNVHSGHRQRLKGQFLEHGLDPIHDVNVLELLLFYAIPRQDTNAIAHRLLDAFGSIGRVFDASVRDLMEKGGLSESAATLIKLVPAVSRRAMLSRSNLGTILDTTQKCGSYMAPYFYGEQKETVYLLGMDSKCKTLDCVKIADGGINEASFSTRTVVEQALRLKATMVIIAHNHTSGVAVPSKKDVETTMQLAQALDMVGVMLVDHIVFAGEDFVSMAESGIFGQNALERK